MSLKLMIPFFNGLSQLRKQSFRKKTPAMRVEERMILNGE
jgi:hypothetical protein